MILLMYHSNMLSPEQIIQIPRTTRNDWNTFLHQDYFGYEMAKEYIADFDCIKEVLRNKHLRKGMKIMCTISNGYKGIIACIEGNKKLLRENANQITSSIEKLAKQAKLSLTKASHLIGVNTSWYYRHRTKKICRKSNLGKCYKQYPNQLSIEEVLTIEKIISIPENKSKTLTTLFYDSMRKGLLSCGRSTFSKYAKMIGYKKFRKIKAIIDQKDSVQQDLLNGFM